MQTPLSTSKQTHTQRFSWPFGRQTIFLFFVLTCLSSTALAQKKLWDKTFGGDREDELTMVHQTQDGGFILGGNSTSSISGDKSEAPKGKDQYGAPVKDYWIIKLKADGTKVWDKTIGGNSGDRLASLQQTKDGGYILGGTSDSGKSGDKSEASKGGADFWLVKLDANGTKEWDKTIGGNGGDQLASVQQTLDGGYLLGGTSDSGKGGDKSEANKGYGDYWIVKISGNGNKLWDKTIGGDREDELKTVQQTSDGGYILGGTSWSDKSGDKSEDRKLKLEFSDTNDYWVVKLNPNRTKAWDKTYGGGSDDVFATLQQTSDGGYILGGTSNSSKGGDKSQERIKICGEGRCEQDYWVVKLKADGSKEWDKTIGGDNYDNLVSVKQTADGSYILGGTSSSGTSADKTQPTRDLDKSEPYDYWIVKLNENGSKTWDKTYGGDHFDYLASLEHTQDGGFILGGTSRSGKSGEKSEGKKDDIGFFDYWIVRIDNKGTNLSQNIFFDPIPYKNLGEPPFALKATASSGLPVSFQVVSGPAKVNGNILTLTGTGTVTIKALQAGNAIYEPAEALQIFVVGTAPVFTKIWDKTLGGNRLDELTMVEHTPDGGYILGGTSSSGKSGDKSQSSRDNYNLGDYWVIKLNADGTKEWDKTFGGNRKDILTAVQQTRDGGYILAGWSNSDISEDKSEGTDGYNEYGDPYVDYWIIKIKADGTKEWDKVLGGDRDDWPTTVQQTQDGGYLIGGYSWSNSNKEKSEDPKGGVDYWLIKTDNNGNKEWDKTLGGNRDDELTTIQQTPDGGYLLGGSSRSDSSGDKTEGNKGFCEDYNCTNDYWIIKINANGAKEWDKTFGGNMRDELSKIQPTRDGGYILGGSSYSGLGGNKSEASKGGVDIFGEPLSDYWIVKIKADGTSEWNKTLGGNNIDRLITVQQTIDGGYLMGGTSYSGLSGDKSENSKGGPDYWMLPDYWIIKVKSDGIKDWDKTFGGNSHDKLTTMQLLSDNSYLLGGTSASGIGGDKTEESKGGFDYWILKLVKEQPTTTSWNMRFGGAGTDNFTSAIKTSDGGYLSGGYTNSGVSGDKSQSSQGKNDYWIVKTDQNGKKLWDKRYGGSQDDYLNRVIQTQDGGYLLAGSSFSGKSGNKSETSKGNQDYWVVKTDKQGNIEWDKTFGANGSEELKKVIELTSGDYVLGGYSNSPVTGDKTQASRGGTDYWLVKISKNGVVLWDKRFGGSLDETFGSFVETPDGGFLLGGSSLSGKSGDKSQPSQGGSDYWVVNVDKAGNLVWEKSFGGSQDEEAYSLGQSSENTYFISGTSSSGQSGDKSQPSQGGKDYWLVTLDQNGNKLWDKTFGGSQDDELRASTYTYPGHYILAGHSYSGVSGDKTQPSQGESDYWVVEVDENGQKVQDQRYGGSGPEELRTVTQSKDGGLLLGGRSTSDVSGDRTQPSQGSTDYWLVKVAPLPTTAGIAARERTVKEEPIISVDQSPLKANPNPFSEKVYIQFKMPQAQLVQVKVYDIQGRTVATLFDGLAQPDQNYHLEWIPDRKAVGIYLLQLQTPTKRFQKKLIKER